MFSRFPSTKSIIKNVKSEQGYIVYSHFYNLSKNKVLFLACPDNGKQTFVKIFSVKNLSEPLSEIVLDNKYSFVASFPDGSFLLSERGMILIEKLIQLSAENLNIISSQKWSGGHAAGVIDNNAFLL